MLQICLGERDVWWRLAMNAASGLLAACALVTLATSGSTARFDDPGLGFRLNFVVFLPACERYFSGSERRRIGNVSNTTDYGDLHGDVEALGWLRTAKGKFTPTPTATPQTLVRICLPV